jgi:hypothetical protein
MKNTREGRQKVLQSGQAHQQTRTARTQHNPTFGNRCWSKKQQTTDGFHGNKGSVTFIDNLFLDKTDKTRIANCLLISHLR